MPDEKLINTLRSVVSEYGIENVERCIREIKLPLIQEESPDPSRRGRLSGKKKYTSSNSDRKSRKVVTASEYIAKMDTPAEKTLLLSELADRFENKSFLPSYGDIRNFFQINGIEEPASGSRNAAIPRIFRFVSSMTVDEIRNLLDGGMFSGPSQLGPIADAIRANSRRQATTPSSATAMAAPPSSDMHIAHSTKGS